MKAFFTTVTLLLLQLLLIRTTVLAVPDVTVSSAAVAASNLQQGSTENIVYVAQMSVSTDPVTVNSLQVTLSGTHDGDDLSLVRVYFNATAPTISGATLANYVSATFAAPHTYTIASLNRTMAAGSSGYFIIAVDVNSSATNLNTIKVNGATNPVVFGFSTTPNLTNTQSDAAGIQTVQPSDVTVSSAAVAASNLQQGTTENIVYVAQMSVSTQPVTVNNVQVTLSGTHDGDDLSLVRVYFNATAPTISGATLANYVSATFAAPHTYTIASLNRTMAAGSSGYFIIAVDVNSSATNLNTIKVNGATNPVVFGFSTTPNLTNTQSDAAGIQTVQPSDVTVSSAAVAASNLQQGTTENIVYVAQMSVSTQPVTVNNVQVTLSGTHDGDDLSLVRVYFNATAPTISGATLANYVSATFAAPHTYTIASLNRTMAAGSSGYFIIAVDVNSSATNLNTIKVNGATNPVVFGFSTTPNLTNTQSDAAGIQTVQPSDVTVSSAAVAASNLQQGTTENIVYVAQMSVSTQPVTVNNVQVTLSGTHDGDDLSLVRVYFNATAPTISGATLANYVSATFAAPHTYTIASLNRTMAAGSSGYFIIAVDVNSSATNLNTIKVNGATNPVVFGFSTTPNLTNTQSDAAGIQTVQPSDVTVSSAAVAASNLQQGTTENIVYVAQMSVSTQPVTVNNVQVTLSGTHDGDDLSLVRVYFNATAPTISGATLANYVSATFAAPHTYTIASLNRTMAAGSSGYFIIAVDVSNTADFGHTVKVNGAADPLVFGFSTIPNLTNNQSDVAGIETFGAALPVTLVSFTAATDEEKIELQWKTSAEINNDHFDLERSLDGTNFLKIATINGNGTSSVEHEYEYLDEAPVYGNNYYRLKQVDIDGHYAFSAIVKITLKVNQLNVKSVYPNPVKNLLQVRVITPDDNFISIRLHDLEGRIILQHTQAIVKGENKLFVDTKNLVTGIYYLQLTDQTTGKTFIQKIIVTK